METLLPTPRFDLLLWDPFVPHRIRWQALEPGSNYTPNYTSEKGEKKKKSWPCTWCTCLCALPRSSASPRAQKQKKTEEQRLTWNDLTFDLRCFRRDGLVKASVLWQLVWRRRSHKVSVCWRRRLPRGQQGGGGPRGKALNFCQAQITTPFFTSWFFNWENHCVPQSYELYAHAMSQPRLRPDRIHCLSFTLFYCVVRIVVVFYCSCLFQDCIGRTTS